MYINAYIKHLVLGEPISANHLRLGQSLIHPPTIVTPEQRIEKSAYPPADADRLHYALRTLPVEGRDAKFYELWKPHCDLPFTVMIQPYSQKGDKRFFSSLFACTSWGVARLDAEFLKHVWLDMGLPEEFNLQQLVKEHVEACLPGAECPEVEPLIYRKTIEEVMQMLQHIDDGKVRRKRFADEEEKVFLQE